jgi:hypothetical protein
MDVPDAIRQKILLRHYNAMKNMRMKDLQDSSSSPSGLNSKSCSSCDKSREKHRELAKKMRPSSPSSPKQTLSSPLQAPLQAQAQSQAQAHSQAQAQSQAQAIKTIVSSPKQDKKQMRGDLLHHLREQRNLSMSLKRNVIVDVSLPLKTPIQLSSSSLQPTSKVEVIPMSQPIKPPKAIDMKPIIITKLPQNPLVIPTTLPLPLPTPRVIQTPPTPLVTPTPRLPPVLPTPHVTPKRETPIPKKSLEKEKSPQPIIDSLQKRLQQQRQTKRIRTDRPPPQHPPLAHVATSAPSSNCRIPDSSTIPPTTRTAPVPVAPVVPLPQPVTTPVGFPMPKGMPVKSQDAKIDPSRQSLRKDQERDRDREGAPPLKLATETKNTLQKAVQVVPGTLEAMAAANQQKSRPTVVILQKQGKRVDLQPDRRRKSRPISFAVQRLRRPLKR